MTAVGHSLGGLVVPLLPELVDVKELVFLCSPLPRPGLSLWDQLAQDPDIFLSGSVQPAAREAGRVLEVDEDYAVRTSLPRLPRQRPGPLGRRPLAPAVDTADDRALPLRTWPPAAECRYVLGRRDRILNPAWARRAVPQRLDIEPIEIDTGHSPFLARPAELADILVRAD